jgi:hypothetical protein
MSIMELLEIGSENREISTTIRNRVFTLYRIAVCIGVGVAIGIGIEPFLENQRIWIETTATKIRFRFR